MRQKKLFEKNPTDKKNTLFSFSDEITQSKSLGEKLRLTHMTISLDTFLFLIILVVLSLLTAYLWGIHNGRILSKKELLFLNQQEESYASQDIEIESIISKEMSKSRYQNYTKNSLKNTLQKEETPPPVNTETQEESSKSKSKSKLQYSIQIASSKNGKASKKMLSEMKAKGYNAYIKVIDVWYTILIGPFVDKIECGKVHDKLKKEGFHDALITKA